MDILFAIFLIFVGLILADLTTAFVHWIVDNYASRDWPFIGRHYVAYAHDHHDDPLEILRLSFVHVHWFIFTFTFAMGLFLYLIGGLNIVTISALVFGGATNFIHQCSHKTPDENFAVINMCHRLGLLQSPKAHTHHHEDDGAHYALLTDYTNPIIEATGIFPFLERCLEKIGIQTHWWEKHPAQT